MKCLPSRDFVIQVNKAIMDWIGKSEWKELRLPKYGGWKPRAVSNDSTTPSVVLEGVELALDVEHVIKAVKENYEFLGIPLSEMMPAPITFIRYHCRNEFGSLSPIGTGRLFDPKRVIDAILCEQGLYMGSLPIYARPFVMRTSVQNPLSTNHGQQPTSSPTNNESERNQMMELEAQEQTKENQDTASVTHQSGRKDPN